MDLALKVHVVTEEGYMVVSISDAATRSEYARYLSFVGMSLSGYSDTRHKGINQLAEFEGRTFKDANGHEHPYITDHDFLIDLYDEGKLDLEGYYDEMAK
jgi:hypothetical protein